MNNVGTHCEVAAVVDGAGAALWLSVLAHVREVTSPDERTHAGPEAGPGCLTLPRVGMISTHINCVHQVLALATDLGPKHDST